MKRSYYLFNPGRLSRRDNTLKFTPMDEDGHEGQPRYIPVEGVEQLYVFGSLDANSALYNFLGKHQVSVHFFDFYENYTGSFTPKDGLLAGKMLLAQAMWYENPELRLPLAKKFVEGASFNMIKNLRYYDNRGKDLAKIIQKIKSLQEKSKACESIEQLMGWEGNMRIQYYDGFNLIINGFTMGIRSKMPPLNPVNALISFGNMMCYAQCLRAIHQTQLHPTISFLHQPGLRRYSLALDLAEIFKPLLVDRVIFKLLNKSELKEQHFDKRLNRCLLNEKGKKIFIKSFEDRLNETIKHRVLNRSVSYKHLIKLECYKISKQLLNMETYKPFKMWW